MLRVLIFVVLAASSVYGACKQPQPAGPTVCKCPAIPVFDLAERNSSINITEMDIDSVDLSTSTVIAPIDNCTISISCTRVDDDQITVHFTVFTENNKQYSSTIWEDIQDDIPFQCNLQDNKWYVDGEAVKDYGCVLLKPNVPVK